MIKREYKYHLLKRSNKDKGLLWHIKYGTCVIDIDESWKEYFTSIPTLFAHPHPLVPESI